MRNFLDFYDIFVNQLVGDPTLFCFIVLAIVGIILVKARAPSQVFITVMFAVSGMLSIYFPVFRWILAWMLGIIGGWLIYSKLRKE